jgi:tetraacyldisaccharide-1-P 4'-kinase
VAVAGIARPERFFAALAAEGWEIVRTCVYRDHHWFTPRDLEHIGRVAAEGGADTVVTTEKDAVRLDRPGDRWAFLPMRVTLEPADQCTSWLADRLHAARRRRGAAP